MKAIITDYTFDASAKTITFTGEASILLERVYTVVNLTDSSIIYSPVDATKKGTVSTNVLTLTYDTSAVETALGTTVSASAWSAPAESGLAIDSESLSGSVASVILSGGTVGRSAYHAVTCTATFANNAVRERAIGIRLVERIWLGDRDKDPGDTTRFTVDWSAWLKRYGTTIASGSWIVSEQLGVTTVASTTNANPTSITLSGGTVRAGKLLSVDNRIVAANGLRDMQSFNVRILDL